MQQSQSDQSLLKLLHTCLPSQMAFSDCVLWFPSKLMQVFQWRPKISQWHCEKQKFIVFLSHHLNHLAHRLNGNWPPKEVSSKSKQTGSHRTDLVVSTDGLDTCKLAVFTKGMIIWLPALCSKYSLLLITRHEDHVRYTLPATSHGSKQDVVVVRWVHKEKRLKEKSEIRAYFQHM